MDEPLKFVAGCWTGRRWRCCAVGLVSHAGPATRSSNRHPVLERQRGARSGDKGGGRYAADLVLQLPTRGRFRCSSL
jgi:hypothetical protein